LDAVGQDALLEGARQVRRGAPEHDTPAPLEAGEIGEPSRDSSASTVSFDDEVGCDRITTVERRAMLRSVRCLRLGLCPAAALAGAGLLCGLVILRGSNAVDAPAVMSRNCDAIDGCAGLGLALLEDVACLAQTGQGRPS
jgi:hypothetical protein